MELETLKYFLPQPIVYSFPLSFLDSNHLRETFSSFVHKETKSLSSQEGTIFLEKHISVLMKGP